jgi:hypothetical protein
MIPTNVTAAMPGDIYHIPDKRFYFKVLIEIAIGISIILHEQIVKAESRQSLIIVLRIIGHILPQLSSIQH